MEDRWTVWLILIFYVVLYVLGKALHKKFSKKFSEETTNKILKYTFPAIFLIIFVSFLFILIFLDTRFIEAVYVGNFDLGIGAFNYIINVLLASVSVYFLFILFSLLCMIEPLFHFRSVQLIYFFLRYLKRSRSLSSPKFHSHTVTGAFVFMIWIILVEVDSRAAETFCRVFEASCARLISRR